MEVRWSPQAAEDLERIAQRILRDNPAAAREVVETLYNGITNLKTFPNRGRTGRTEDSRVPGAPSLRSLQGWANLKPLTSTLQKGPDHLPNAQITKYDAPR